MQTELFLQAQLEQVRQCINRVEKLKLHDTRTLTWKPDENSWSILECLEHLNRYGDFYLPQIENKIRASRTAAESQFRSGMIGGYFAQSMLPKPKLNRMKTMKAMNPLHARLDRDVIDRFLQQQHHALELINQSRRVSLNRVKITTSLSRLIRMNLGDTWQFLNNHILRHLEQIARLEQAVISKPVTPKESTAPQTG